MYYRPDFDAPAEGEWRWSESGEPVWVQQHDALVGDAIHSWKGWPSDMRIHMQNEADGEPQPRSGSGKQMRARAAALLWELNNASKPSPTPLFRGSHVEPVGLQSWTTRKSIARLWAGRAGTIFRLPPGAKGLRVSDYRHDVESEWLVMDPLAELATERAEMSAKPNPMFRGRMPPEGPYYHGTSTALGIGAVVNNVVTIPASPASIGSIMEAAKKEATPNTADYYVFEMKVRARAEPLRQVNKKPLDLKAAKQLARIGAKEGKHDRAVTTSPKSMDFRIVAQYEKGTGDNVTRKLYR